MKNNFFNKKPWMRAFYNARQRCKPGGEYHKKGVRFCMCPNDFYYLWMNYKAYLMDKPSIHRVNPNNNYMLDNCVFMEFRKNISECRRYGKRHSEQGKKNIGDSLRGTTMKSKYTELYGHTLYKIRDILNISEKEFYKMHKTGDIRRALEWTP